MGPTKHIFIKSEFYYSDIYIKKIKKYQNRKKIYI